MTQDSIWPDPLIPDEEWKPPTFMERVKYVGFFRTVLCMLDEWCESKLVPVVNNYYRCYSKNIQAVKKYNFVLYSPPWWFLPMSKIQGKLAKLNRWFHKRKIRI